MRRAPNGRRFRFYLRQDVARRAASKFGSVRAAHDQAGRKAVRLWAPHSKSKSARKEARAHEGAGSRKSKPIPVRLGGRREERERRRSGRGAGKCGRGRKGVDSLALSQSPPTAWAEEQAAIEEAFGMFGVSGLVCAGLE